MGWQAPGRRRDRGPAAGSQDHVHTEYWTGREHERYEDRVAGELHGLRVEVRGLASSMLKIMGGLALLTVLGPLIVVVVLRFVIPTSPV